MDEHNSDVPQFEDPMPEAEPEPSASVPDSGPDAAPDFAQAHDESPGEVTDYFSGWGGVPFDAPEDAASEEGSPESGVPESAAPAGAPDPGPAFEDLTLGQALGYLILRPVETGRRLWRVLAQDSGADSDAARGNDDDDHDDWPGGASSGDDAFWRRPARDRDTDSGAQIAAGAAVGWLGANTRRWVPALVLALAMLLALRGGIVLHDAAVDPFKHYAEDTDGAGFWFVLAGAVYGAYALYAARDGWARRFPGLHARLYALTHTGEQSQVWTGGLMVAAGALALLALTGAGGLWGIILWLGLAAALWIVALAARIPPGAQIAMDAGAEPFDSAEARAYTQPVTVPGWRAWFNANLLQLALIPVATAFSLLAYTENVRLGPDGNVFDIVLTTGGTLAWVLSVIAWLVVFGVDVARLPDRARTALSSNPDWGEWLAARVRAIDAPLIALVGVIVFGLWFRTLDLAGTPPEMTSDHIEKLLDSLKVYDGYHAVFFPNNGGREAFQMYVVAFIAGPLGVGFNFNALKWATVIEGVLTLPLAFWMAQQVIGQRTAHERQIGRWVGVALAALMAVSSWHLMLSRLGLRIVLTPLTATLVIGFLARIMHRNRTRDYLALGVVLGAGTYFYQANRMLPLLAIVGIGLAILATLRRWRDLPGLVAQMAGLGLVAALPVALVALAGERAVDLLPLVAGAWFGVLALWLRAGNRPQAWRIAGGLLMAGVVALAIYVPMYHYSRLYSDQFWNRTRGRLFGENAFTRMNAAGVRVSYDPSLREQADRFWDQRDVLVGNYSDALRMFHWQGDAAWINNAGNYPALGGITGGLLILGLVVAAVWAWRRRDAALLLLPVTVVIMLLPSALTLAYTVENPSFTRTSGAIPAVFMLAGLPLGLLCWHLSRVPGRVWGVSVGALVAFGLLAGVTASALDWNRENFYTHYHYSYSGSWKPYREIAKPLRTFAQGEGSYGNAFMVAFPHWLDHRILGTMAGDIRWPNGLVTRDDIYAALDRNAGTPYAYDPDRPLWVMYHPADEETGAYLQREFPGGEQRLYRYSYRTAPDAASTGEFYIYTVRAGEIAPQ